MYYCILETRTIESFILIKGGGGFGAPKYHRLGLMLMKDKVTISISNKDSCFSEQKDSIESADNV